jgi:NAD(P)-dependent dehydrogenase (short-subunit alcohol dehydrogenase family)
MSAFTNKVAVITGGNSRIGLATAEDFSRSSSGLAALPGRG